MHKNIYPDFFAPSYSSIEPTMHEIKVVVKKLEEITPSHIFIFRLNLVKVLFSRKITPFLKDITTTLDLDDIESKARLRYVNANMKKLGKRITINGLAEVLKLKLIEYKAFNQFSRILVCSTLDKNELQTKFRDTVFEVAPNVVEKSTVLQVKL